MRFLIDMNLSPWLAQRLRSEGHDAIHVVDIDYAEIADSEIFKYAAADNRTVVTFDLDFGDIAGSVPHSSAGVALFRVRTVDREFLWRRLQAAIAAAGDVMESGALVIIEDARLRIRRMPPG